ncbi:MAG: T9SS type A sorting domain-containing protein, partial [Ignavibacteria bacterium]|nr:T9SS type A sorting domain-containing protein [Ignavibacteria bacterium]
STGDTVWSKIFNGSSNASDFAKKIRVDTLGNVYAAGYLDNTGSGTDIFVVKVSSAGVIQWTKTITGPGNDTDEPYGLEVDNAFNVYLACRTTVSGANTDIMTVKLNPSGDTSWVRKFGGTANTNDEPRALRIDVLGNVYTGGYVMNSNLDMALLRYSSAGLLTAQYILDKGSDNINSLSINSTNEIIATGTINSDFGVVKFSQVFVGVNEISSPNEFVLYQNFPNPFNPQTIISYSITKPGNINILIFDVLGNEIESVSKNHLMPGNYYISWNGENYPSGVYFYKFTSEEFTETRKMILLK